MSSSSTPRERPCHSETSTMTELDAALAALDDADADYEFFSGLFEEPAETTDSASESDSFMGSHRSVSSSERRRQRWDPKSELHVVIRLSTPPPVRPSRHLSAQDSLAHAWEEMAKSQKRERKAAEKENAALRELLAAHTRTVQKMFKLTQKANALAQSLLSVETMQYLGPAMPLEQIMDELDVLALGADAALSSGAFTSETPEFREINYRRVSTATGDAIQLELDVAWLVPFPVESVALAARQQLSRTTPKDKIYWVEDVHKDAELLVTHAIAGSKEMDDNNATSAIIHTQIATRCYPPACDGSILLVMSTSARFVTGNNTWVGSAHGEGFIRVKSMPRHDSGSTNPLSRVEFCRRTRAQPPADANLSPAERSKWMNVAMKGPMRGSDQRVDKVVQSLENLLLTPSGKDV